MKTSIFAAKHAKEKFLLLLADPKAKIRMSLTEARCLLINHPTLDDGVMVWETYAKSIGAGVYEVGLRKVKP